MSNILDRERLFGTDGVRGLANTELSPDIALALGLAAGHLFAAGKKSPVFVVGRDSRISSPMLEAALSAGLCAMGAEVLCPGLMPTPAVACVTREIKADAGVVISASHNPFYDNGIKFFGGDGYKLDDALESRLDLLTRQASSLPRPAGAGVGKIRRDGSLRDLYAKHIEEVAEGLRLDGLRVVIDAANGAASELAPRIFSDLGATVYCEHCTPDGININEDCGALHPQSLQSRVVELGADIGLAFDGDADRCILVDACGMIVDGDRVMAICGRSMSAEGRLPGMTVVGTVMSNMGLETSLREVGVNLVRTSVGDRYVSERMRQGGFVLGGEKSGHLIFGDLTTTGDGILTGVRVLSIMASVRKSLAELASVMQEFPQKLVSVPVTDRSAWETDDSFQREFARALQLLDGRGRINVRASGTEKLVRVMVEGPEIGQVEEIVSRLSSLVRTQWGAENEKSQV